MKNHCKDTEKTLDMDPWSPLLPSTSGGLHGTPHIETERQIHKGKMGNNETGWIKWDREWEGSVEEGVYGGITYTKIIWKKIIQKCTTEEAS